MPDKILVRRKKFCPKLGTGQNGPKKLKFFFSDTPKESYKFNSKIIKYGWGRTLKTQKIIVL